MRPARVIRLIFRLFLLVCTLSLSVVSILGGLSAYNIVMTPGNINIDTLSVTFDINNSNLEHRYINIPFSITNDGYFDLTDLELTFVINMVYNNSDGVKEIYNNGINFGDIKSSNSLSGSSFNATPLEDIPDYDDSESAWFEMDIILSAWYSHRLLNLRVIVTNRTYGVAP